MVSALNALPNQAPLYVPVLQQEIKGQWPLMPLPSVLAAQVEQESVWKVKANLVNKKNNNERGAGLGQFTKNNKFDALTEMKERYPSQFRGWSWDNPYDVTYQLRGVVIKNRDTFRQIKWATNDYNRLAMMDAAYNQGLGGVMFRRRLCSNTPGCTPGLWFGNMENASTQSKKPKAGYKQSFADITKTHTRNVMIVRRPKYEFMDQEGK